MTHLDMLPNQIKNLLFTILGAAEAGRPGSAAGIKRLVLSQQSLHFHIPGDMRIDVVEVAREYGEEIILEKELTHL